MFLFYVLSFFKKGDTIQGGTLFKEIRYTFIGRKWWRLIFTQKFNIVFELHCLFQTKFGKYDYSDLLLDHHAFSRFFSIKIFRNAFAQFWVKLKYSYDKSEMPYRPKIWAAIARYLSPPTPASLHSA